MDTMESLSMYRIYQRPDDNELKECYGVDAFQVFSPMSLFAAFAEGLDSEQEIESVAFEWN